MWDISERIRLSRDRRVRYVIFSRRIFRSYRHNGVPAWTWSPYTGSNPHTLHMHVSVNDTHHDETQDWEIGMNPKDEKALISRVDCMFDMDLVNPYGDDGKPEPNKLAEAINGIGSVLVGVAGAIGTIVAGLAAVNETLKQMSERLDSLEQGPEPVHLGTATLRLESHAPEVAEAMLDEISRGGQ